MIISGGEFKASIYFREWEAGCRAFEALVSDAPLLWQSLLAGFPVSRVSTVAESFSNLVASKSIDQDLCAGGRNGRKTFSHAGRSPISRQCVANRTVNIQCCRYAKRAALWLPVEADEPEMLGMDGDA